MPDRYITAAEAESIATKAAEKAMHSTFALFGIDLNEFESVQNFRGDIQFMKSSRRVSLAVGSKAGSTIIGAVSLGVLVWVANWVRTITGHG